MDHIEWLRGVTKGDSVRGIGRKADIPERTVDSQIKRRRISAENVIAIAMGYKRHPVTALVDCGYLDAKYADAADPVAALREVSEEKLADEVLRRMNLAGDHRFLTMPLDELLELRNVAADSDIQENGDAAPKGERAVSARDSETSPADARRRTAAAIRNRIPRTADARQRRKN